jgi:hypothetical protein
MSDTVRLEWTFTPPDYFEEARTITAAGHSITIDNGKAEARIDMAAHDADRSIRARLHEALNAHFLAAADNRNRGRFAPTRRTATGRMSPSLRTHAIAAHSLRQVERPVMSRRAVDVGYSLPGLPANTTPAGLS